MDVGSVFEVSVDGRGYMLADSRERPYRRQVGSLQAQRFATSDSAFNESLDRYTFVAQSDWSGGAGQVSANRSDSLDTSFADSKGVEPFGVSGDRHIKLLKKYEIFEDKEGQNLVGQAGANQAVKGRLRLDYDEVFYLNTSMSDQDNPITLPEMGWSVAQDNAYQRFASVEDGRIFKVGVYQPFTSAQLWASVPQWSAIPSYTHPVIEWIGDRMAVVYRSDHQQWTFTTLGPDGSQENPGGWGTLPDEVVDIAYGSGHVWLALSSTDDSGDSIYSWKIGSSDAPALAAEFGEGVSVTGCFYYLGNLMVRAWERLYRCVPNDNGTLTTVYVGSFGTVSGGGWHAEGTRVYFDWTDTKGLAPGATVEEGVYQTEAGIGVFDLETGGAYRDKFIVANYWLARTVAIREGGFLVNFEGPASFFNEISYMEEGYLTSSVYDLGSSFDKVIDGVSVTFAPLDEGAEVAIEVSADAGVTWAEVGSVAGPSNDYVWDAPDGYVFVGRKGETKLEVDLDLQTVEFAYRVKLRSGVDNQGVSTTPYVRSVQLKVHPVTQADAILELPINTSDSQTGLNGSPLTGRDSSRVEARRLENLVGKRVVVSDVDWPQTGESLTWEVVAADSTSVGIFDRRLGRRTENGSVTVLTMRRPQ